MKRRRYLASRRLVWPLAGLLVGLNWDAALLVWLHHHHTSLSPSLQSLLALLLTIAATALAVELGPRKRGLARRGHARR